MTAWSEHVWAALCARTSTLSVSIWLYRWYGRVCRQKITGTSWRLVDYVTGCKVRCLLWPPCVADADIIFSFCGSFFLLFSSPNLSGRRVHVYHTYLIAAIVMTFRVLEGHPHIARIFKCDFRILARLMVPLHLQSLLYSMLCCGFGFSGSLSGDVDRQLPAITTTASCRQWRTCCFNCIDDSVH